jgi:hypothetical protein
MEDGKRYTATLSTAQVNGYWRIIGVSQSAWMRMPESQRVQFAWDDMQARIEAAEEATRRARESQGNKG